MSMFTSSLASELATIALELRTTAATASHQALVRQCLIDATAATVAGYDSPAAAIAARFTSLTFGAGQAFPWLTESTGTTPIGAAFVNSSSMSALDIDDGNRAARGHLGAAVIPAASAIGSITSASAETFTHAVIAGCEIGARLGSVEAPPFFASGRWASVGAAVASGVSMGLSHEQLTHAVALAVHAAPLLAPAGARREMTGHIKEGVPFGVLSGMSSALLAQQGYRGDPDAVESSGIYAVDQLKALTDTFCAFGRTYFKRYSCCRLAHAPIDAAVAIALRERLAMSDIAKITVRTFRTAIELPNEASPASFESAQFSLPFAVAVALVRGPDALLPLSEETLRDRQVVALAERVELLYDATLDHCYPGATPAEVRIQTCSGSVHVEERDTAEGDPARAFTDEQLLCKLRTVAEGRLSKARLDKIVATVGHRVPTASEFEAALKGAPR
jgi:2-methylcitrate dehydratase PrpD